MSPVVPGHQTLHKIIGGGGHQTDRLTLRYHWFFKYHKIGYAPKITTTPLKIQASLCSIFYNGQ
jgi:hypothetical protein